MSFLDRAAIQLLMLRNSIVCVYTDLAIQAEQVSNKVTKIVKIIGSILKKPRDKPITVEEILENDRINKTSQLENDLLAFHFDKIYDRYENQA